MLVAVGSMEVLERRRLPLCKLEFCTHSALQRQRKDAAPAVQAFEKYLALAPEAADANLIKHYLAELKP
ncbi:MAG: hypothetical protein ACKO1L_03390 [Brachymonas sp.]